MDELFEQKNMNPYLSIYLSFLWLLTKINLNIPKEISRVTTLRELKLTHWNNNGRTKNMNRHTIIKFIFVALLMFLVANSTFAIETFYSGWKGHFSSIEKSDIDGSSPFLGRQHGTLDGASLKFLISDKIKLSVLWEDLNFEGGISAKLFNSVEDSTGTLTISDALSLEGQHFAVGAEYGLRFMKDFELCFGVSAGLDYYRYSKDFQTEIIVEKSSDGLDLTKYDDCEKDDGYYSSFFFFSLDPYISLRYYVPNTIAFIGIDFRYHYVFGSTEYESNCFWLGSIGFSLFK